MANDLSNPGILSQQDTSAAFNNGISSIRRLVGGAIQPVVDAWNTIPTGVTKTMDWMGEQEQPFREANPTLAKIQDALGLLTSAGPGALGMMETPKAFRAIRTAKGEVLQHPPSRTHLDIAKHHGIAAEDILDTGFVTGSEYKKGPLIHPGRATPENRLLSDSTLRQGPELESYFGSGLDRVYEEYSRNGPEGLRRSVESGEITPFNARRMIRQRHEIGRDNIIDPITETIPAGEGRVLDQATRDAARESLRRARNDIARQSLNVDENPRLIALGETLDRLRANTQARTRQFLQERSAREHSDSLDAHFARNAQENLEFNQAQENLNLDDASIRSIRRHRGRETARQDAIDRRVTPVEEDVPEFDDFLLPSERSLRQSAERESLGSTPNISPAFLERIRRIIDTTPEGN